MSILRTCIVSIRNVSKCRMSCVLVNNDRLRLRNKGTISLQALGIVKAFHTTRILDKVVAFKLSDIGEGIREVTVKEWFVKVGDKVQQFDNICEVQSDKAAVTITSRYDGTITKLYADVDQTAYVGQPLIDIEVDDDGTEDSSPSPPEEVKKDAAAPVASDSQRIRVLTTPAVRRIAAQFKVNLSTVKATGRHGRVLKEDVLAHLGISAEKSNEVPDASALAVQAVQITAAKAVPAVEDRTVPITGFMKAMLKSMSESMKIPHLVLSDEYDVTKLYEARQSIKSLAEEQGVKLSYMPIILKAASLSLTEYPVLNSSPDSACEKLTYKASHNIGLGMDTPNGLVVPVIKDVQNKSILEIARELNVLQEKGMKGQLGLNDLSGGTFTLSNVGVVGGTYASPIIFSPQVSIGALGKIQTLPRFDAEGNVVKAHILTVSWAADHRVVDGATVARFSNRVKQYLENPYTLLLDL
ncbi:lipoamide acyltransferase component of branched-chain alpha-keto acid dehydrogenase complex, mitochondrial [Leguminivora glycinivorella]|uniref:lipoamide acyltransferase component of branched-chain alpha-keto acid dehydrogenase complex, mitochondrial n=1 Tax=Leguminivora glycinivorella TaxID=1035111 RepID=UPI00200D8F78|nr:lipoamide acyltransferase component of branched-chain alpha-keto acid dehydrogenase complex, mitochondrial [Leguminivora glycinivorella]